jgi:hypothetical protein
MCLRFLANREAMKQHFETRHHLNSNLMALDKNFNFGFGQLQ